MRLGKKYELFKKFMATVKISIGYAKETQTDQRKTALHL
jgi:hypothetical protein